MNTNSIKHLTIAGKKTWTAPTVNMIELNSAKHGAKKNGPDAATRS